MRASLVFLHSSCSSGVSFCWRNSICGYDGKNEAVCRGKWTEIKIRGKWKDGDVVGVACDLDEGSMRISRNGDFLPPNGGVVFGSGLVAGPLIGCFLFPAIAGDRVRIRCNFGLQTFKHLPPAADYLSFFESACPSDHKVFF